MTGPIAEINTFIGGAEQMWENSEIGSSSTPLSEEVPVVQGLIDFLVSSHKIAQELRDKLIFKVVPMMNPDGVYLGNYRGNLLGRYI